LARSEHCIAEKVPEPDRTALARVAAAVRRSYKLDSLNTESKARLPLRCKSDFEQTKSDLKKYHCVWDGPVPRVAPPPVDVAASAQAPAPGPSASAEAAAPAASAAPGDAATGTLDAGAHDAKHHASGAGDAKKHAHL
jgi:hypothetical protein